MNPTLQNSKDPKVQGPKVVALNEVRGARAFWPAKAGTWGVVGPSSIHSGSPISISIPPQWNGRHPTSFLNQAKGNVHRKTQGREDGSSFFLGGGGLGFAGWVWVEVSGGEQMDGGWMVDGWVEQNG